MTTEANNFKYQIWVKKLYTRELIWESTGTLDEQSNPAGSNQIRKFEGYEINTENIDLLKKFCAKYVSCLKLVITVPCIHLLPVSVNSQGKCTVHKKVICMTLLAIIAIILYVLSLSHLQVATISYTYQITHQQGFQYCHIQIISNLFK